MMIADAQARQLIKDVLGIAAQFTAGSAIPFERTQDTAWMIQTGGTVIDNETDQTFHPVVFVLISESEERAKEVTEALLQAFQKP